MMLARTLDHGAGRRRFGLVQHGQILVDSAAGGLGRQAFVAGHAALAVGVGLDQAGCIAAAPSRAKRALMQALCSAALSTWPA